MFSKLGRGGGGRGSGKRPLSTPSQLHRPGDAGGTRPQIGASGPVRVRPGAPSLPVAVPGREETFSLEPGELDLGAIIRLTPDIVKEIKRVEAQGGSAKIKFDANANNSDGNVVEVGGKEFRFTWSRERTDLCDIYEERRNGDDGDGLLVECGAAWRKLNVQRILDESTKNHVKMRSEEAERMLKSRKTIVLDPTNPSVKNQAKSMAAAAVEGNTRRMGWKQKKEMLLKKRKIENSQGAAAVSQSKFASKSATISNGNFKGIPSPAPSPQQARPRSLLSNSGIGKTTRGDTNPGAVTPLSNVNKEEIDFFVKEMANGVSGESMQEINGHEEGNIDPPVDLQSMLITLLSQNPKGMSLKAIEKALGETVPNSMKKIENALKNVATLQALGRYFLKQGRQIESSTRSSEGGSSPECSKILAKKASSVLSKKAVVEMLDQETRSTKNEEASDLFETINIVQDTEDPLDIDEKARDNSMVRAGSLSESGSDSDSESSSSGSDSESQSRSKAGSGSASSSDSESDVSSSSKEASDVDVDIMTSDDERGVAVQNIDVTALRLSPTALRLSPSPRLWRSDDEHDVDINERDQKSNGASPALDLSTFENIHEMVNSVTDAKDLPIVISGKTFEKLDAKNAESIDSYLQQSKPRSSVVYADHNKVMENQHESPFESFNNVRHRLIGRSINEEQILMKGGSEQQDNHESVNKLDNKRSSNSEYLDEKSQNAKRIKASSSVEATFGEGKGGVRSSKSSCSLSPEKSMQMDQKTKIMNNYLQDGRREFNLDENLLEHATSVVSGNISKAQSSPDFRGPPNFASEQSGRKTTDSSGRKRTAIEKPIKYVESLGRANKHMQAVSIPPEFEISAVKTMQAKGKDENGDFLDKRRTKNVQENEKSTDGYANGKGSNLRRELSDLELGEFREPLPDATREDKMTVERTSSFKKIESIVTFADSNVDINMGKCDGNGVSESKRQSSPSFRSGMNGKILADVRLDLSRSKPRFMQPQSRQSSKMNVTEPETIIHQDKCAESGGKNGTRTHQMMGAENEANGPKRSAPNRTPKDDSRRGILVGHTNVKESKSDKLNGLKRSKSYQGIDGLVTSNGTDSRKSLGFSSEEENAPYKKYKKDELHLRGPIKDFSMYKDYVREFQEKYSHYCSLEKKLEKNRNDFLKVGDDLELARGRDLEEYYKVVEKLQQMFNQHVESHKEMKRIYISLYEELKNLKQRVKDFVRHSGE